MKPIEMFTPRELAIKEYGLEMGAHCALAHAEGVGMAKVHTDCPECLRLIAKLEQLPAHTAQFPPPSEPKTQLTNGAPVPEDHSHTELLPNGQQKGYVVLSPEERAKGFVRPVRRSYRHVGRPGPKYPLRDLTDEEFERFRGDGYVKYEEYPPELAPTKGRYWTQRELDGACHTVTTMGQALAETYARDPKFYGGTFCAGCGKHYNVGEQGEFVWEGTEERVGT